MKHSIFRRPPRLLCVGRHKSETTNRSSAADVIFFGRSGASVNIDGTVLNPASGDIVIVSRKTDYTADCEDIPLGSAVFVTVADAHLYGSFAFEGSGGYRIVASGVYRGILEAAFRQILREYESDADAGDIVSDALLNVILTLTVRLMPFEIRPGKSSGVFEKAKAYFDENFLENETLADVCLALNVDRYYLSHVFKKYAAVPPKKYLIEKRMEYAEQLLRMTEKDIIVIARECGYGDPAYFCRIFKDTRGCTALEYRAKFKRKKAEEEKQNSLREKQDRM